MVNGDIHVFFFFLRSYLFAEGLARHIALFLPMAPRC